MSPFAADISIKKTPVKNKAGVPYPPKPHVLPPAVEDLTAKNLKLEEELAYVKNEYAIAIDDAKTTREMLEKLQKKNTGVTESKALVDKYLEDIKNLVEENNQLKRTNENKEIELRNLESLIKIRNDDVNKLGNELKELREKFNKEKREIIKNKNADAEEQLARKNDELKEAITEKVTLEEKVTSLLDILYGCNQCGLLECECKDSDEEDNASIPLEECVSTQPPPPLTPTPFLPLSAPLPPPSSGQSPWTPPPTPPCSSCGGINFGPSPSNVCFVCIPPLLITSQHSSRGRSPSPSRTPPGTPPLHAYIGNSEQL